MQTTLLSSVKDEGPWIIEWVAFHQLLGFQNILIYSNDCSDQTDNILNRLEELGHITHEQNQYTENSPRPPQREALIQAQEHPIISNSDWVFISDTDEFLNLKEHNHINEFLQLFNQHDALIIYWRSFGPSNQAYYRPEPVIERFTTCHPKAPLEGTCYKTFFKPSEKIDSFFMHYPILKQETNHYNIVNTEYKEIPLTSLLEHNINYSVPRSYNLAQVNHYVTKSKQEFYSKQVRGYKGINNIGDNPQTQEFFEKHERLSQISDISIQRFLPELKKQLTRLMSDPMLQSLHKKSIEYHQNL